MGRVIFKTIVSGTYELPFVLLNLIELYDICDEFLITESDYTHVGEFKGFDFENCFNNHIKNEFPKAKYVQMKQAATMSLWSPSDENDNNLRKNEQKIRNGFLEFIDPLDPEDIMISVDGDEVLYNSKTLRGLIAFLKLNRLGSPRSFTLSLNQFFYYLNLQVPKYEFYGPVVCNVSFFFESPEPHWRYLGKRILRPLGCHFSWVMSPDEMLQKISRYAHRDRLAHLMNLETLQEMRFLQLNLMEPNREFNPKSISSSSNKIFPSKLFRIKELVSKDLVLNSDTFWH